MKEIIYYQVSADSGHFGYSVKKYLFTDFETGVQYLRNLVADFLKYVSKVSKYSVTSQYEHFNESIHDLAFCIQLTLQHPSGFCAIFKFSLYKAHLFLHDNSEVES